LDGLPRPAHEDLVADIVRTRIELPGAREALRAERAERASAWEEQLRAMEANARSFPDALD
jgi:hypothetical protein